MPNPWPTCPVAHEETRLAMPDRHQPGVGGVPLLACPLCSSELFLTPAERRLRDLEDSERMLVLLIEAITEASHTTGLIRTTLERLSGADCLMVLDDFTRALVEAQGIEGVEVCRRCGRSQLVERLALAPDSEDQRILWCGRCIEAHG